MKMRIEKPSHYRVLAAGLFLLLGACAGEFDTLDAQGDMLRLMAVIGCVMLLCMVLLGVLISRSRIASALKLGED